MVKKIISISNFKNIFFIFSPIIVMRKAIFDVNMPLFCTLYLNKLMAGGKEETKTWLHFLAIVSCYLCQHMTF